MRAIAPLFVACTLGIAACSTTPATSTPSMPTTQQSADERFQAHAAAVLEEMWQEFPEAAVRAGNYKYADRMSVPDQARRERSMAFYDRQLAALARFDLAALSASNRIDLALMKNRFEQGRWNLTTFKGWQWNPSSYNVGGDVDLLDHRVRAARCSAAPGSRENRQCAGLLRRGGRASPARRSRHTELAIRQSKGALTVFGPEMMKKVEGSGLTPAEKALFAQRVDAARRRSTTTSPTWARWKRSSRPAGAQLPHRQGAYERSSPTTSSPVSPPNSSTGARWPPRRPCTTRWRRSRASLWPKYLGNAPVPADRLVMIRAVIDELQQASHQPRGVRRRRAAAAGAHGIRPREGPRRPGREPPWWSRDASLHARRQRAGASISAPGPLDRPRTPTTT